MVNELGILNVLRLLQLLLESNTVLKIEIMVPCHPISFYQEMDNRFKLLASLALTTDFPSPATRFLSVKTKMIDQ